MTISTLYPDTDPSLLLDFAKVKALDPRITFTRASEGRYYDGKTTAKAEENLLTNSQDFAPWSQGGTSTSANSTTAPDGTSTADLVTENGNNSVHIVSIGPFVAGTNSWSASVYAKANGRNWILLEGIASNNFYAWFDLSTGSVGTAASGTTATIESVGNSWYRCKISKAISGGATSSFRVYLANADNVTSYAGDGTSGVYLWGAQLEQRSATTAYTATTTQPITNYVPQLLTAASGVARFDHNPVTGESLGLLIEEQRANLLLQSEDFSTTWQNVNSSEITNIIVTPNGTLTGDKLVSANVTGENSFNQGVVSTTNTNAYTFSVYCKAAEFTNVRLVLSETSPFTRYIYADFNLSTGTLVRTGTNGGAVVNSTFVENVGNNWYRVAITSTLGGSASGINTKIILNNGTDSFNVIGNGYSGIYIWGAQLEVGAFATSYIPTVASQVTRSADAASMTGTNFSSWYRQDEGTIYASFNRKLASTAAFPSIVSIESSSSNRWGLLLTNDDQITGTIATNNTFYADLRNGVYLSSSPNFSAMSLSATSANASGNGSTPTSDTSLIVPVVNKAQIGNVNNTGYLNGHIYKIAYYPKRLTNAQLQALTK